jgi:hypothetical protein
MARLWRIIRSPGVVWWGIPTALLSTYWRVKRETGWSWGIVTSGGFWVDLVIVLLFTGVFGGLAFEWTMRKIGFPLRPLFDHHESDRAS